MPQEIHEYLGSQIRSSNDVLQFLDRVEAHVRTGFCTFGGRIYTVKDCTGELSLHELITFVQNDENLHMLNAKRTGTPPDNSLKEKIWRRLDTLNKEGNEKLAHSSRWAQFWTKVKQLFNIGEEKGTLIQRKLNTLQQDSDQPIRK